MLTQLDPCIPVKTPKGTGVALFLIDYSLEHDLYWVVCLDESGEMWTFNNRDIRGQKNFTAGRVQISEQDEKAEPFIYKRPELVPPNH